MLDAVASGPAVLLLVGEAGIGKTAVWREAVERARSCYRVLECRPCQPEANLSFAGLGDLLQGTLDGASLSDPQRRALEAALRLGEPATHRVDKHSVGAGVLSVLRQLPGPVVIAIDDCHWLDRPSARALAFAIRRLRNEPIGLLLSARSSGIDRVGDLLSTTGLPPETVDIVPLADGEIMRIVANRHGQPISPRELERVAAVSGGNPFVALAVADALKQNGALAPGDLPLIPANVGRLFDGALEALAANAQDLLLAAALAARPSVDEVARAMGVDPRGAELALDDAAGWELVQLRHGDIQFTHPLVAAAVRNRARPGAVRAMHRRLAAIAPVGSEDRGFHLALGAESTDAVAAGEIDAAARAAGERGAPESAAELYELAAGITPADELARWRRQLLAAEHHHQAGDLRQARRLAQAVVDVADPDRQACALLLLAELAWLDRDGAGAVALGERALQQPITAEVALEGHTRLAYLYRHDRRRGLGHAHEAVRLLDAVPTAGPAARARALFGIVYNEADLGLPLRWDLAKRAMHLQVADPPARVSDRISYLFAICMMQVDALDRARPLLEAALEDAIRHGDEGSLPQVHDQLFQLEWLAGRWRPASDHAAEHLRLASQLGQEVERVWALESAALIAAHRGDLERARDQAKIARELALALGDDWSMAFVHRTSGFIALSAGDSGAAAKAFALVDEITDRKGLRALGALRHQADHIEALIELGELARAAALLESLSERADIEHSPWGAAAASRSRALLEAAKGDLDAAAAHIDRAEGFCQTLPIPFEQGRTLLAQGMIERRRRQKRRAGAALRRATDIFAMLGAPVWASRAQRELARVGVRPAAPAMLTESERQVVELVRRGLANREVAAQLFISEKTVEGVLTRAYRKLGVRGRSELMASNEPPRPGEPVTAAADSARA